MSHVVLIVNDGANVLSGLTRVLHKEFYQTLTANSTKEGAETLAG